MTNRFRFNPGDLVTSTVTGFNYIVQKTTHAVSGGKSTETMELMRLSDGAREVIDSAYYGSWVLTNTLKKQPSSSGQVLTTGSNGVPQWAPMPQLDPHGNIVVTDKFELPDLRGKLSLDFVPISIQFGDEKTPGCQHDWVTWTGLHGTVTDCTKCKAKQ